MVHWFSFNILINKSFIKTKYSAELAESAKPAAESAESAESAECAESAAEYPLERSKRAEYAAERAAERAAEAVMFSIKNKSLHKTIASCCSESFSMNLSWSFKSS